MEEKNKQENLLFEDIGKDSNKNTNWTSTNGLIINVDKKGTTLKMSKKGIFNYSPNISISGDFEISMDIYMPKGDLFLSFGFSNNQEIFTSFKGWWKTLDFQKLIIKRVNGYVKYYLNNEFKEGFELDSDNLFFQFRIYSNNNLFDFTFKNLKISKMDYKSTNSYLIEQIDNLDSKIKSLNTKLETYEKNSNLILDSYHNYFNILFIDYELKPKKLLKSTHLLCQELLNFIDNICNKYNLEYWLYAGNLLGAFRHGGFIPWDDDMDIAMMREDYNKFIKIIKFELKKNNLDQDIEFRINYKSNKHTINTFVQLFILHDDLIFAGLDIFPHDFLKDPKENFEERYMVERNKHFINLINGVPRNEVYEDLYKNLDLTFEKADYISFGVEFGFYPRFDPLYIKTDILFPLKSIQFEGKYYPCPNDTKAYLNIIYLKYNKIPKIGEFHSRQEVLKNKKNSLQIYDYYIKKLKKINENMELQFQN